MTHHSDSFVKSYERWDFVEVALHPNAASRIIADLAKRLDVALGSYEPSDAQVEAALEAWMANAMAYGDVAMRAALCAAAKERGGNHG